MQNVPDNLPKKPSRSLLAIAQALAGMGARAVPCTSVARTESAGPREMYNEITRKS
jgi:hypothetical protein